MTATRLFDEVSLDDHVRLTAAGGWSIAGCLVAYVRTETDYAAMVDAGCGLMMCMRFREIVRAERLQPIAIEDDWYLEDA